jgi:heat shock protein HtpX
LKEKHFIIKKDMVQRLKTFILLAALTVFLVFMGKLIGGKVGMTIALAMAGIMNFLAYFFSDKIVLAMYGARANSRSSPITSPNVGRTFF